MAVTHLTLLRHGESVWNRDGRLAGWTDVQLTRHGMTEAAWAGQLLSATGWTFDLCFSSYLSRAMETLRIVLETMGLNGLPVQSSWRLNERHYGAAQGLTWWQAIWKYSPKQVLAWRRDFTAAPPAVDVTDPRFPGRDPRYQGITAAELPRTESLRDIVSRVAPYWDRVIAPEIQGGKHILIVAHQNSLRSLLKHLGAASGTEMPSVAFPTGTPLVVELNPDLEICRHYFLRRKRVTSLIGLAERVFYKI